MQNIWTRVDDYFCEQLVGNDPVLDEVLQRCDQAGLPAHHVAPNQGKLLMLLAQMCGAGRVLEVGTLGAYSTIWLARAVGQDGRVVTLESNAHHAEVACGNLALAGLSDRVDLRLGPASASMQALYEQGSAAFDLIFIDADKPSNPIYLDWAMKLVRPGSIIIGDNVVRNGAVADPHSEDANVLGVRRFMDMMRADTRLDCTALQTVGCKGYDGFSLARVR